MLSDLGAMWLLGFLGTGHCIGMCGPLVAAFPGTSGRFSAHVVYHLGRMSMYTLIGAGVGAASGAALSLQMTALIQTSFSIFAALFLVWFGLIRLGLLREPRFLGGGELFRFKGFRLAATRAAEGNLASLMLVGFFMGLIPCGLSYAAFARVVPVGGALTGAALLAAFGLGTLPGLLLLGTVFSKLVAKYRAVFDTAAALVMFGMGLKLILDVAS